MVYLTVTAASRLEGSAVTSTSPALVESRYAPFGVRATRFIFDGLIVLTIWSSMLLLKYLALFVPTGALRDRRRFSIAWTHPSRRGRFDGGRPRLLSR